MKQKRYASRPAKVAVILGEDGADVCSGSVLIICGRFDHQSSASRGIALVDNFLHRLRTKLSHSPLDGSVNIFIGHALCPSSLNRSAQPRIARRLASAELRGDGNFLGELREE